MNGHPIENLMNTAMNNIKDMIDVNTIIGDPIETANNMVIIPISKVGFGFAAGGSEFKGETVNEYTKKDKEEQVQYRLPFGGGSGAGVNIVPIAFLVVGQDNVKLLPVDHASSLDKLLDYVPDLLEKVNSMFNKKMQEKNTDGIRKVEERIQKTKENGGVTKIVEKTEVEEREPVVRPKKPNFIKRNDSNKIENNEFEEDE